LGKRGAENKTIASCYYNEKHEGRYSIVEQYKKRQRNYLDFAKNHADTKSLN
jgi:hypothetical protein